MPDIETMAQEHCGLQFALTESDPKEGTFKGLASVFGSMVDSWMPTVIEPGAFTKTLQENLSRVKILWQHNLDEPIGLPLTLKESSKGLEVEGRISQTTRGRDALQLMKDKVVDELSIGFDPIKYEMEEIDGKETIRHIKEVRLWEISLVTFAADPKAKVRSVHAVVPYQDLALADEGRSWSVGDAHNRVVSDCDLKGDSPDWVKFKRAHLWFDPAKTEDITGYKFLIADIIDGKLLAVPRAIFAAAGVLMGARGGTKISQAEQDKMKAHLARYYKKMDRTAPWDEEKDSIELVLEMFHALIPPDETHEGKVLSSKNKKLLQDAVAALNALLPAAEPPDKEDDQALTVNAEQISQLARLKTYFAQLPINSIQQ